MKYDIIKVFKNNAIIKIDKVYYLINTNYILTKVEIKKTKRGSFIPKEYLMFFNEFEEVNNKYIIRINTLTDEAYSMSSVLDKDGNMSNKYLVNAYGYEYEVILPKEDMLAEDIISRCICAINNCTTFYLDDQIEAEHVLQ